ncbi:hypothetical protein D1007_08439 [Hordeum vulgare]|nr:hypothetical protein D1007_08439 [Hordeum vulgare]
MPLLPLPLPQANYSSKVPPLPQPCKHAINFITGIRGVTIVDFVDDYYNVAKFTAAYAHVLPGLTDMSQWPNVNKDFTLNPPILRRAPGRTKVQRHKSGAENSKGKGNKGHNQCPICKAYRHRWQSSKDAAPEALAAYAEVAKQKGQKKEKTHYKDNVAKSKSSKTTSKSTRSKAVSVAPDNPAMGTRSKRSVAPDIHAMSTRSKKKLKM